MPNFIPSDTTVTALRAMEADPTMITNDSYSPTSDRPDGRVPFVEHHLAYLRTHKLVDPTYYLSNLALMIKKR